ncbi:MULTISPECIES: hypothetical protein [unclassified Pseudomonas]|uniref:hypothetical protein n=1 Tax=unclassified Pseudomonas TaxID=196821 RepID=UPI000C884357|nr:MULTISPECIES: hypothetical protein [unclassified Pseudomonas]PMX29135.1 hypothetical protein C1Y23_02520 [Pseudomonas sp. GW460-12]PMX35953.1 hypothetical protein C1Y24_07975 [Pseudomonas sp. MPR-R2A4]PMX42097.1 hypothetical protein C1Y26_07980 [Pseudomonas sp. MPR-R2A7]PMX54433.1 hypothetical protein C1Y17_08455 [Pseudomonas sp. MPR-R2A6]PMX93205.1 hypothetical protein C1Y21_03980 [Pseudomonas sp. MPR-R2A3]
MHPEHFDLSSPVFLPITFETAKGVLDAADVNVLSTLTDPELAAILVIQNLAQMAEKDLAGATAEKILARLIGWAVDARHSKATGLWPEAQRLFDPRKLYFGLEVVKQLELRFLLADEVSAQDYLLPNGQWDTGYKLRHLQANNPFSKQMVTPRHRERWLSAEQDKLVRTFRANLGEDLHVQGYAGIGKSHLLVALMEHLQPEKTLLLARTEEKLETLRRRMVSRPEKQAGQSFHDFARTLLHGPRPQPVSKRVKGPGKLALAHALNILGLRHLDAQAALDVCLKVLECYCRSRDYSLSERHLPFFKQPLSGVDVRVLLEYSSRLWGYLEANPLWGNQTGFEALLMIKRANLAGCTVHPRCTHVLIDESQDIPASLLQILERGRQVLITLGDEYQQTRGIVVKRARTVRQSNISHSVRSGRNIERLVNPLIFQHSKKSKVPFEGARDADVVIEYYPRGFVPPEGCVVLVASLWDMMKWAIELHDASCAFGFPSSDAQRDLVYFMTTAIGLFKPEFYRPSESEMGVHPYFSDMPDWQQVRDANQCDESFLWVEAKLDNGFKIADLTRLNRMFSQAGKGCLLMLADEAGGMEFDRVLLTTGLLTNVKIKDPYELDERICSIYIAISRAKQQLYLPYDVVEWIEYQNDHNIRETPGF